MEKKYRRGGWLKSAEELIMLLSKGKPYFVGGEMYSTGDCEYFINHEINLFGDYAYAVEVIEPEKLGRLYMCNEYMSNGVDEIHVGDLAVISGEAKDHWQAITVNKLGEVFEVEGGGVSKESFEEWFVDTFGAELDGYIEKQLRHDTKFAWDFLESKLDQKDKRIAELEDLAKESCYLLFHDKEYEEDELIKLARVQDKFSKIMSEGEK